MPTKGIHSVKGGHKTKRSVGAYGSTRGKERQKKKRQDKIQNSPRVRESLEAARLEQQALEARIAAEQAAPANGPAIGAQYDTSYLKPEPEPVPAQRIPSFSEVRLVQPDPPKPRQIQKAKVLGETRSIKVDPWVWQAVLESGADLKCVQIISATEVIIRNKPGPW